MQRNGKVCGVYADRSYCAFIFFHVHSKKMITLENVCKQHNLKQLYLIQNKVCMIEFFFFFFFKPVVMCKIFYRNSFAELTQRAQLAQFVVFIIPQLCKLDLYYFPLVAVILMAKAWWPVWIITTFPILGGDSWSLLSVLLQAVFIRALTDNKKKVKYLFRTHLLLYKNPKLFIESNIWIEGF